MSEKKLKIFLTGGNGFIGKNILEQLGDKYEFISPGSKDLDLTNFDEVSNFIKELRPDLVIHAANIGGKRNDKFTADASFLNLKMFFNIVKNKKYFGRLIFFGSGAEYDKQFDIKDVKEEDFDKRIPSDQYGFYKYICSKYIEKVDFIINLRIFGIYGKYENYSTRFISNNICRSLLDLPISVNKNSIFEFVFIDDFIKILDYFINNRGKEKIYNIGSDEKFSLLEIAEKISLKSGKNNQILVKEEGLGNEYTCNASKLMKEITDFRFTKISEGISKLFDYYSGEIKNMKKEELLFD